jgi:hypothetical protein
MLTAPYPQAVAHFGEEIAIGDVNGDGVDDVVVGAPFADADSLIDAGQAVVILGPELTTVVSLPDPSPAAGAHFGRAVATGDVNGDGIRDVIVGAPFAEVEGQAAAGQVVVFLGGNPFMPVATALLQAPEPQELAMFGWTVASGNVNGDGVADIIVGATAADVGEVQDSGQAFVFLGSDFTTVFPLTSPSPQAEAHFSREVMTGDVNGDGVADVIVGEPFSEVVGLTRAGRTFVFWGGEAFDPQADVILESPNPQANAWFGRELATGDSNMDGVADLVIAAPHATIGDLSAAGEVFVFLSPGFIDPLTLTEPTPQRRAVFGRAVTTGDLMGNGVASVVVGAPKSDTSGLVQAGEVFLFLDPTLTTTLSLQSPLPQAGAHFGDDVTTGDVNGDGAQDIVTSAPQLDVDRLIDAGGVFVFLSTDSTDSYSAEESLSFPSQEQEQEQNPADPDSGKAQEGGVGHLPQGLGVPH